LSGPYGYAGRLLRVDLTRGKITVEPSAPYVSEYLGARGLAQRLLFDEVDATVRPFDEGNKVILSAGPLVGTVLPASGRLSVDDKNPITGGVGSSNAGGHLAPELKFAGFDAVVIEGQSPRPVVLYIADGRAEIRHAEHLWGLGTGQTEAALRLELREPRLRVGSIGPAGENRVVGACLIVDGARAAGRSGAGAVLGSKRVKAIAVRGTLPIQIFDPRGLLAAARDCWSRLERSPQLRALCEAGTHGSYAIGTEGGFKRRSVRNLQDAYWPADKYNQIREEQLRKYKIRRLGCFNCPIYCSFLYRLPEVIWGMGITEGVPANAVRAFGENLDVTSPESVLSTYALANQLGMDVDMSTTLVAWAVELAENGLLSAKEVEELGLHWGSPHAGLRLLPLIAHRQGLGALFADGIQEGIRCLGEASARHVVHTKGASFNEAAVRTNKGYALGIVVSVRGGGHLDGAPNVEFRGIAPEISKALFGVPTGGDPTTYEGKGQVVFGTEQRKAVVDMMGMCYMTSEWLDHDLLSPDDYAELLHLTTGIKRTGSELMALGRRLHNVEKAFNTLHAGFSRQDDMPPDRLVDLAISAGPWQGEALSREGWDRMLTEYYRVQGWDAKTGWQTAETLHALGLDDVAENLRQCGRLAPARTPPVSGAA
jgi:aldehyde:ferredoxin oxidoreductase